MHITHNLNIPSLLSSFEKIGAGRSRAQTTETYHEKFTKHGHQFMLILIFIEYSFQISYNCYIMKI